MKSALITGGNGFLGSVITQELTLNDYEIKVIGQSNKNNIQQDLRKSFTINEPFDIIVHNAGKAHSVPKTESEIQDFFNVNFQGTLNLLKALKYKPKYFVFISTVSVYGLEIGNNVDESFPLKAEDPYGKSKLMAEKEIMLWGEINNVIVTILRLPLIYGDKPKGNLKKLISGIEKGYYFNIGGGKARKSMVSSLDVAKFIPRVMKIGGIYNLTDGQHPSFAELSNEISKKTGTSKPISIPIYIIKPVALIFTFIKKLGLKLPFDLGIYKKMVNDLTFNDKKAREIGWNPRKVIDHLKNGNL